MELAKGMEGEGWRGRKEVEGRPKCYLLSIFLLILLLHCISILFFTRGFLLTRTELPHYSNCSDFSQSPCLQTTISSTALPRRKEEILNQSNADQRCWTKPAIDRLVIIVLDALRFDFVAPSTFFEEKTPWMDKLQVLHKLASQEGSSARIFKAIADPPTTSLQRLKGLTTGGLPTFIDVGNSFGAPAIIEDNLIYQLVQNGKRVVMMGDDTWLQLFPHHFNISYPFPSFNVKDLHTVDDGCTKHLFHSLHEGNWDVLIAHFLGVDHAGHIFGINSIAMTEKLEQYNVILDKVVEVLESHSRRGGLHENTLLLVIGDHGQTVNGDHGGGAAEEVETAIFAMGMKKSPSSLLLERDDSSCQLDLDGKKMCINSIQQLDFAATVSALLGIPFPFGSIGRVNPELYALAAGTWNFKDSMCDACENQSETEVWMQNYVNVLCINSWQVKRYIDVYSASSVIGFSNEDLLHLSAIYAEAMENWSNTVMNLVQHKNESCHSLFHDLRKQVDAYFSFLGSVAELARSKWTEFDLNMMAIGLAMMLISLLVHLLAVRRLDKLSGVYFPSLVSSGSSIGLSFSCLIVAIRAFSFLSNSYILEEGKVACFLVATTGILNFRYSITKKKMSMEALLFLLLISILRFSIQHRLSKQDISSVLQDISPSWMLGIAEGYSFWAHAAELVPVLALIILAFMLHKSVSCCSCSKILKYVITGTMFSYLLIAAYWVLESKLLNLPLLLKGIERNVIPRTIYVIGCTQLFALALLQFLGEENTSNWEESMVIKIVAMLSAWSSTVIILSGRQGPLVALAFIIGGWCLMRLESVEQDSKTVTFGTLSLNSHSVTQWSLLSVCLFFCTGHWCAFDGLRYAAAFIGFEEFTIVPQAILLSIDTFGFSHILPIFGLPFLVIRKLAFGQRKQRKQLFFLQLSQAYLMYGLITATAAAFTVLCVTIQRRHLMVWGLFAPKFVFDVVGLILTDVLIILALLYYFGRQTGGQLSKN
ncbi:uncharacterized protein LOC127799126 [Diospyros lotus]|uniref:uncharacterized protein LOC127799126 n=1 Tax=Diospyros lotus TaxID=55363 RepID=UPI00224DB70E|nr:uncharacterized protein LOC127799126 [Diospyros lotus]